MTLRPTSLIDLREKLVAISTRAGVRELEGWRAFQQDEIWDYSTRKDGFECPHCVSKESSNISGDIIGTQFPLFRWDKKYKELYPNTHANPDFPYDRSRGDDRCRCKATWLNYPQILTERLGREFEEVTG